MSATSNVQTAPNVLTYKFHDFRPSDRAALRAVALSEGGEGLFLAALGIYLKKWANAEWLTEYEIERIAVWAGVHLPRPMIEKMAQIFSRERDAAQTENAKKTYQVMSLAIQKELRKQGTSPTATVSPVQAPA